VTSKSKSFLLKNNSQAAFKSKRAPFGAISFLKSQGPNLVPNSTSGLQIHSSPVVI
jgi:hypothetical protein